MVTFELNKLSIGMRSFVSLFVYPYSLSAVLVSADTRLAFERGVLSMLDEECLLPHGTDSGFVSLLEAQTQVSRAMYLYWSGPALEPSWSFFSSAQFREELTEW